MSEETIDSKVATSLPQSYDSVLRKAPSVDTEQNYSDSDTWLDAPLEKDKEKKFRGLWAESISYPVTLFLRLLRFSRSTPGRMTLMVTLCSLAVLAAGVSMSQTAAQRRADLSSLISNTEPVSYLAHNLYTSLSYADTTATVGFVQSGNQSTENRDRYTLAYQEASRAVTQTAAGISDTNPKALQLTTRISELLPTYTGLVETAWANNRQGNPVGVAYMSEANALMRQEILPAANELYTITTSTVVDEQRKLALPLFIPISGLFASLGFLVASQIWLARATHRRLNRGFVAATLLMLIATIWVTTASALTWQASSKAYEEAAAPLEQITNARIMAQQARTSETLALVRRQAQDTSVATFDAASLAVAQSLDAFEEAGLADDTNSRHQLSNARRALDQWNDNHQKLLTALEDGNFDRALEHTLGNSTSQGTAAFTRLDFLLASLVDDSRSTMRTYIGRGVVASSFVSSVVLVLSIIAMLSLWLGIRPRLQEYL